jgi:serine/threonine protein kinase
MGNQLGEGAYGEVSIVIRNCRAIKSKTQMSLEDERSYSFAIKQILIPNEFNSEGNTADELFNADLEIICINREFQSLSRLDHPFIAELLEVFFDSNFIYFVSPFYTGGEINDLMYTAPEDGNTCTPLTEEALKPLLYQVLKALNYLKQNSTVHRDIKPANIMIENFNASQEQLFVKLIDFGFSQNLKEPVDSYTQELTEQVFMGTTLYAAPEVLDEYFNGVKNTQPQQADIWALGVIIFFLLSGEHPFGEGAASE